ncbi:MAG: hypothetical protein ACI4VE_00830 [Clostridia bacterium]
MVNSTYAKAYTEVLEIIKFFSKDDYNKIPNEKIEFYKKNMDTNYKFTINPGIDLAKQNISTEANAIIVNLFRNYFATENQKAKIKEILDINQYKKEQEKREKYNPDNLFKSKETKIETVENSVSMVEYKESIFTRIKNWFKRTF